MRRDNRKGSTSRPFRRDGPRFGGSSQDGPRFQSRPRSNFNDGPREMHKATCAECNSSCEVPFKPTEGKPVYCKDCYLKRKNRF